MQSEDTPGSPIRAIPTVYRGLRFRSRLEATWAVFMDSVQWRYEYEPIDLAGYIPDFIIESSAGAILVEVKAELHVDDLRNHTPRIDQSGWNGHVLIIGATPVLDHQDAFGDRSLGLARENGMWSPAHRLICRQCGAPSWCHQDASWSSRICGHHAPHLAWQERAIQNEWATAKNQTQWRPAA